MKKIKIFIKSTFLTALFASAILFVGFIGHAHAAGCSYDVAFDVNPKTVQFDGKITFTTTVKIYGTDSGGDSCANTINSVYIKYYATSAGQVSDQPFYGLNTITDSIGVPLTNGSGKNVRDYYLNNFFTSNGKDKNSGGILYFPITDGSFFVRVFDTSFISTNVRTSGVIPVKITAPSSYPQVKDSSNSAELVINNYSVKLGDTIQLAIKNGPTSWAGSIIVNGTIAGEITSSSGSTPLAVTTANGFKTNFQNDVSVILTDGTELKKSVNVDTVAGGSSGASNPNNGNPSSSSGGMQGQSGTTLYNPIEGVNNITELLLKIMNGFLAIIGIWAVIFIVIGGFRMVMSEGNDEAVAAAKKTITWAVLGLVAALLSFSIIAIIQNLLGIDIKG